MDIENLDAIVAKVESSDYAKLFLQRDYAAECLDFLQNRNRTLNYFKAEQLVFDRKKRSDFTFLELIWIRIVYELKELGVKNDLIKSLKEYCFAPPENLSLFEDLAKEFPKEVKEHALKELGEISPKNMELINRAFDEIIQDKEFLRKHHTSNILHWTLISISNRIPLDLRLYSTGEAKFNIIDNNFQSLIGFENKHYISISITSILSYYLSQSFVEGAFRAAMFTPQELEVLVTIRKVKCKSITIKFSDDEIESIAIEQHPKVDPGQRIAEILLAGGYQEITLKTANGKIVSVSKITKRKLRKK